MLHALGDSVIVDPYFDPDKIGSIIIPDMAKNAESNQGRVASAGRDSGLQDGDYVLYHPFRGDLLRHEGKDYLPLRKKDVVAVVNGKVLLAMSDHIMIQPLWESKYAQPKSGLVYMPQVALEHHQPVLEGMIVHVGIEVDRREYPFEYGTRVLMQPAKGSEVAWIDTVYYFLRPSHILACLP